MNRKRILALLLLFFVVGCRKEVVTREVEKPVEVTRVVTEVVEREKVVSATDVPTSTITSTPTSTLIPTSTETPIPDSVLDYGIDQDSAFTWREARLAVRVFNGELKNNECVQAARIYLEGHLEEGAPQWKQPVSCSVPLSTSFTLNGVELRTTSKVAFKLKGEAGEEGWLYEVTAPAGTFISQLACRRQGELYTFNANVARDGVAYLFVWRKGLSKAFFMGGCANFGVVEDFLPTPTSVPPTRETPVSTRKPTKTPTKEKPTQTPVTSTKTPVSVTETPRPTNTPVPTATPPPEPTPQPATLVPTATAQPEPTSEPTETSEPPPPTPTEVPATSTPVPPVLETPEKNPTATP